MKLKVIQTQPDNQNIKPEIFQIYGRNYSETLIETKKKKMRISNGYFARLQAP